MNILMVALGGAIGSIVRYLMQGAMGALMGKDFPYGTLLVNILGSGAMGLLIGWLARHTPANAGDIRLFCAVGLLGGFTTFSSFSLDAITLMEEGKTLQMCIYILASVTCSLLALAAGLQLMRLTD